MRKFVKKLEGVFAGGELGKKRQQPHRLQSYDTYDNWE